MWVSASVSVSDCLCLFNLNLNSSLRRVALRGECLNTKEEVYPESDEHTHMHLSTDKKREFGNRSNTQTPMDQHTQIYVHTFSLCKVCFILSTFKTQMLPHSFQDMLSFRCDSLSVCTSLAVFGTLVFLFFFNYTVFPHAWYSRSPLQIFIGDDPVERTKRRGQRKWEEGQPFSLYRYQKTKTNQSTWPQFTDGLSAVFVGDNGVRRALPRYYNVSVRVLGFTMSWSRTIPCQRRLCT